LDVLGLSPCEVRGASALDQAYSRGVTAKSVHHPLDQEIGKNSVSGTRPRARPAAADSVWGEI